MDDCNANERAEKAKERACSDSSMDDCNTTHGSEVAIMRTVQIPLWTIVTRLRGLRMPSLPGSDSSMDDCNKKPFDPSIA